MSTITNIATSGLDVQNVATTLAQGLDQNKDGKVTSDEFLEFLTRFTTGIQQALTSSSASTPATAMATPAATSPLTATRAAPATPRRAVGTLGGFDWGKLNDPAVTSFKYQIGRILRYYPNTPAGLQAALPEIQQLVPGAQITGANGDKIDFGDYQDPKSGRIGVVDVLAAAGDGGKNWQWQPAE